MSNQQYNVHTILIHLTIYVITDLLNLHMICNR